MSRQFELNKVLFEAVTACNYEEAERLLNLGADPLGSTNETDADEHLLGELFFAMQDNEDWVAAFPKFLYLCNHGISFINNQVYYGYYRNTYAEYLYNQTIHCVSPYH